MPHVKLTYRVSMTTDNRQRLQIWISETTNNIPPELFVYQVIPCVPLQDPTKMISVLFVNVASYAEVIEYPTDRSEIAESPFFRQRFVDLVFDSLSVLQEKLRMISGQTRQTVEDICRINNLGAAEYFEVSA